MFRVNFTTRHRARSDFPFIWNGIFWLCLLGAMVYFVGTSGPFHLTDSFLLPRPLKYFKSSLFLSYFIIWHFFFQLFIFSIKSKFIILYGFISPPPPLNWCSVDYARVTSISHCWCLWETVTDPALLYSSCIPNMFQSKCPDFQLQVLSSSYWHQRQLGFLFYCQNFK